MTTPLFPPTLIPASVTATLPVGYTLRPLTRSDYGTRLRDVLGDLTTVGEISQAAWDAQYDAMAATRDTYYVMVMEDAAGEVVATGAALVERKFIHGCGKVAHLEDIAVARDQQGKSLGRKIIAALVGLAKGVGCYKAILDCGEQNVAFYEKCGFRKKEFEMALYFEEVGGAGLPRSKSD